MTNLQKATEGKDLQILSAKLWPESSERAQYQNMRLLLNGTKKTFTLEQVEIICKECGCDANYLFNIN